MTQTDIDKELALLADARKAVEKSRLVAGVLLLNDTGGYDHVTTNPDPLLALIDEREGQLRGLSDVS